MKFHIPEEWYQTADEFEKDVTVAAGALAFAPDVRDIIHSHAVDEARLAFGQFVSLMRRNRGLTREALAKNADVDVGELLIIEQSPSHEPEPRTVYQLASYFKVSNNRLMQLAGLMESKDKSLIENAVRYAACSEPVTKLNSTEKEALNGLVAVLTEESEH